MPNSRHTEVRLVDVLPMAGKGLITLAVSEESGVGIMATADCKRVLWWGIWNIMHIRLMMNIVVTFQSNSQ